MNNKGHIFSKWQSPSNIALIKYWGKLPGQIPANASISFTLKNSVTEMSIEAQKKDAGNISLDFYFEGQKNDKFREKIHNFLSAVEDTFYWIKDYHLIINSKNTFPHSSGIASSASSMSSLVLCLLNTHEKITNTKMPYDDFYQKASDLSRQASGSAARSVYPFLATWGKIGELMNSSDLYASPLNKNEIHSDFHDYKDAIIVIDGAEKSVSSRAGHSLMQEHPFKHARYEHAKNNMSKILVAMKQGDLKTFIEIVEEEALMLHALMMTSKPSYILLKPNSLLVIDKIRQFRNTSNVPVCFTIDAGPNIHVLYRKSDEDQVEKFIEIEFSKFNIIYDEVGTGPLSLE